MVFKARIEGFLSTDYSSFKSLKLILISSDLYQAKHKLFGKNLKKIGVRAKSLTSK